MKQYPLSGYTCSVVFYVESDLASTPLLKWRHPGLQRRGGVGVLSWTRDWSDWRRGRIHMGRQTDPQAYRGSVWIRVLSWTWGWTLGGGHPGLQKQCVCVGGAHSELDLGLDPRRGTLHL